MTTQQRNQQMVDLLTPDFITRREYYLSGARLQEALYMPTPHGGGRRRWAWDACSGEILSCFTGLTLLTETNISNADYEVTRYGAPCVSLDGATEYYAIADSAWQEGGAENFFVWGWFRFDAFAGAMGLISKVDTGSDLRSWMLYYTGAAGSFSWLVNSTGLAAANVIVSSSVAEVVDTWYFIAGFYQPSTLIRIFVGAASDMSLTVDSNAVGIPASLFNGAAPFGIGCYHNVGAATALLDGYVSQNAGWGNTPAADINSVATYIWARTKSKYL